MPFFNIDSNKIKFTIIDNNKIDFEDKDCYLEVSINRSVFKKFLFALKHPNYTDVTLPPDIVMTKREIQVLNYLSKGKKNGEIAQELNVSLHTAKAHIHNIFFKLRVKDRTQAVVKAIKRKLIDI